jgi:hypothetical protein
VNSITDHFGQILARMSGRPPSLVSNSLAFSVKRLAAGARDLEGARVSSIASPDTLLLIASAREIGG